MHIIRLNWCSKELGRGKIGTSTSLARSSRNSRKGDSIRLESRIEVDSVVGCDKLASRRSESKCTAQKHSRTQNGWNRCVRHRKYTKVCQKFSLNCVCNTTPCALLSFLLDYRLFHGDCLRFIVAVAFGPSLFRLFFFGFPYSSWFDVVAIIVVDVRIIVICQY